MNWSFHEQVVLVTGASSGIGRSLALAVAREGSKVALLARNMPALEKVLAEVKKLGASCVAVKCDVTKPREVQQAVEAVTRQFKTIDVLINNAGFGQYGFFLEAPVEEHQKLFDTNFFGVIHMLYAVLPIMKAKKSGVVVNVSSMAGLKPLPKFGIYSASKAALNALSESLRHEVKPFGIHVLTVCPGITETSFRANAKRFGKKAEPPTPPRQFSYSADDVARETIQAVIAGKRLLVPGFLNRMGVRLDRMVPNEMSDPLVKRYLGIGKE